MQFLRRNNSDKPNFTLKNKNSIMMKLFIVAILVLVGVCYGWGNSPNKQVFTTSRSIISKAIASAALSFGVITSDYSDKPFIHSSSFIAQADDKTSTSVFVGNYNDPNHPGCLRKISVKGKDVSIVGSDNLDGSKQWLIKAKEDYPGTIFVDFSPKGGPSNLLGVYNDADNGIKWPDGNLWSKLKQ